MLTQPESGKIVTRPDPTRPDPRVIIIKKLYPFMPLNRVPFWEQLKAADGIPDLITEDPFI